MRTYVLNQQLLEHLPPPPAPVLDVGGGAGHQSFPLAQAGYDVTLLDPSPTMLDKAQQRLQRLPGEAQRRVTLLQADGSAARSSGAAHGRRMNGGGTAGDWPMEIRPSWSFSLAPAAAEAESGSRVSQPASGRPKPPRLRDCQP